MNLGIESASPRQRGQGAASVDFVIDEGVSNVGHAGMRVLIATITAGGGPLQAAAALEEAWRGMRPRDTIEKVDLLKFFSPLHKKVHADGYVTLVEKAPELWGLLFKTTDNPKLVRRLTKLRKAFPPGSTLRI